MIKTVIFDVGNVLCNFDNALRKLSAIHSVNFSKTYEHWLENDPFICKGDLNPEGYYDLFLKNFNTSRKLDNFLDFWVSNLYGNIEVGNLLIELSRSYEIGIITNMYSNVFDIILEKGIIPKIDYSFVIKSCDIGYCKPDREIYEYAMEKIKKKGEILFTDDMGENLLIPKALGWKVVLFDKEKISESIGKIKQLLD